MVFFQTNWFSFTENSSQRQTPDIETPRLRGNAIQGQFVYNLKLPENVYN